jgi:hypothetical protein
LGAARDSIAADGDVDTAVGDSFVQGVLAADELARNVAETLRGGFALAPTGVAFVPPHPGVNGMLLADNATAGDASDRTVTITTRCEHGRCQTNRRVAKNASYTFDSNVSSAVRQMMLDMRRMQQMLGAEDFDDVMNDLLRKRASAKDSSTNVSHSVADEAPTAALNMPKVTNGTGAVAMNVSFSRSQSSTARVVNRDGKVIIVSETCADGKCETKKTIANATSVHAPEEAGPSQEDDSKEGEAPGPSSESDNSTGEPSKGGSMKGAASYLQGIVAIAALAVSLS